MYRLICFLPLFGNVSEALLNTEFVKHLTSQYFLLDKQYGFGFSSDIADVLTAISDFVFQALDKIVESRAS